MKIYGSPRDARMLQEAEEQAVEARLKLQREHELRDLQAIKQLEPVEAAASTEEAPAQEEETGTKKTRKKKNTKTV